MNSTDLLRTVTNLGSPRVLLVGDFMLDAYIYGDALRISPEAPVQVLKVVRREHSCGGAASVAADVLAMGARCFCIGIIGSDDNGRLLSRLLTERGADISGLTEIPNRPTICKQRIIGLAQHRHRQQLLRIDEEITEPLSKTQYDALLKLYISQLPQCDVVCLQDYNKGMLDAGFCQALIQEAKKTGKKVLVDPPPTNDYTKFTGATLMTPNRKETSLATGMAVDTMEAAKRAAVHLHKTLHLEASVITLDKEGAYLHTAELSEHLPTHPRTVYDVTGAGDMMLAAIAVVLGAGCDFHTAVAISNIAAGLEVEKFGVATVTIEEIVHELVSQRHSQAGKVRDIEHLAEELGYHRKNNKKIVFTNGCFDVLHIGHIHYLRFCKDKGDILVVGMNSDSSVRQIKGPDRPINNQTERAEVLAALEFVDYVVIFDQPDPLHLVEQVCPDILVKGADWAQKGVIGREFVEARGGQVILAPLVEGKSSTATIEKMRDTKA